jgi:predicted O-methyltransferase YrrM
MSGSIPSKIFLLARRLATTACRNPRGLRHVLGTTLVLTEGHLDKAHDIARLPALSLEELADGNEQLMEVVTCMFPRVTHSITLFEAVSLGLLLRKCQARRVFEFGTNRGISTTQLALNVTEDGRVFTLDLPEDRRTKFDIRLEGDIEVAHQAAKADLIPQRLRDRVVFLRQDSATFDEQPYAGTMDAVFVDGAHVYDYVRNDSGKGWRMLRPGGTLIWHDFRPQTPDVVRYLLESEYKPRRIEGSTLAFAIKPG